MVTALIPRPKIKLDLHFNFLIFSQLFIASVCCRDKEITSIKYPLLFMDKVTESTLRLKFDYFVNTFICVDIKDE